MHRFFVERGRALTVGETVGLEEAVVHQVRDVLRLGVGEQLVLLDGSGEEMVCVVKRSSRAGVEVEVLRREVGRREPGVQITLCQGMLKSARFEWILEKGTELGVRRFVPVVCRRSTAGLEGAGGAKVQRWQRIIQEAAEQCGRARVPELMPIRGLKDVIGALPVGCLALLAWEEEQGRTLREVLQERLAAQEVVAAGAGELNVVLFVGPEGGLEEEEVRMAREGGVEVVSLGRRILRAETAALAMVANVVYELEGRLA